MMPSPPGGCLRLVAGSNAGEKLSDLCLASLNEECKKSVLSDHHFTNKFCSVFTQICKYNQLCMICLILSCYELNKMHVSVSSHLEKSVTPLKTLPKHHLVYADDNKHSVHHTSYSHVLLCLGPVFFHLRLQLKTLYRHCS